MTAQDIINEWAADSQDKQSIVIVRSGLPLRWLNQGQLRYVERALCLRDTWTPSVPSVGYIDLPTDFLYEFPDRVKRNVNNVADIFLSKIEYQIAFARYYSSLLMYSIYDGKFYVWSPQACTPAIVYVRKPAILTSFASDLEIPTEFQENLIQFMEAKWLKHSKEIDQIQYLALIRDFDLRANNDGITFRLRNDGHQTMRGSFF